MENKIINAWQENGHIAYLANKLKQMDLKGQHMQRLLKSKHRNLFLTLK